MSDPVATFLNASSKGDAHAEYMTSTTRNVCHHLQAVTQDEEKLNEYIAGMKMIEFCSKSGKIGIHLGRFFIVKIGVHDSVTVSWIIDGSVSPGSQNTHGLVNFLSAYFIYSLIA